MDPRIQIRIRIHPKMSWIRNTGLRNGGRAGLVHQHRLQHAVLQVAPPQHPREASQPKAHDEEGGQPEVVGRDAGVLRPGQVFLVDVAAGGAALEEAFCCGDPDRLVKKGLEILENVTLPYTIHRYRVGV
jgi:hypothetical protein